MGRVSRYKKVKSIDPFAKNGSWKSDVGDCATLRRAKRKSKTALKMKEQKLSRQQRRLRGKNADAAAGGKKKGSGGSNGWGDDDGYDLPPDGEDEFDMNDLVGSVKRQKHKGNPLLESGDGASHSKSTAAAPSADGGEKWTRKVERIDTRGLTTSAATPSTTNQKNSSANAATNTGGKKKAPVPYDGTQKITAKTSTREIIAAHTNPKSRKQSNNSNASGNTVDDGTSGTSKQEKRKAFLERKKLKKRKRGSNDDSDDDEEYAANQRALQSLHSQPTASSSGQKETRREDPRATKKHSVKQDNYSETMVARSTLNDQVERPPTFTSLPRGASKLAKNNKKKNNDAGSGAAGEDDGARAQRIEKEQRALEEMRQRVMRQYAALRESRRNG